MVDDVQNEAATGVADVPELTTEAHAEQVDHPHTGIAEEGWSAPPPVSGFARLVIKRGGVETEVEFPISSPAIIGRFDPAHGPIDVDLGSIPEGVYVSRKHAKITLDDGVWHIQDLGSSNGTFVLQDDFTRVEDAELSDGQEIALGNARMVFHMTSEAPPPSAV